MWFLAQGVVLTKDYVEKWKGDPDCYFCGALETNDHLFFQCPIAKVIWRVMAICFNQNDRPQTYSQLFF
jgi:hypothetical protein